MPTYPPATGNRFQLDVDGTVANIKMSGSTTATDITPTQLASMVGVAGAAQTFSNVAVGSGAGNIWLDLNLIFPELRALTALRWSTWNSRGGDFGAQGFWSPDTTDGVNGTWTQIPNAGGGQLLSADSLAVWRNPTQIQTFVQTGIKGIRLRHLNYIGGGPYPVWFRDLHFYGTRATTGDHLHFWDPTQDTPLAVAAFDYGDAVRGTTLAARQFRVKNVSATLTAQTITLSFASHAGAAFTTGQVSLDGTNWATQVTVPNLAPNAISQVLYVRATGDATVSPQGRSGRVIASPASWA